MTTYPGGSLLVENKVFARESKCSLLTKTVLTYYSYC
jgi:hypothetical protein